MKALKATPLLLALLPFVTSCDGDVKASDMVASGKEALGKVEDLSKMGVEDMKKMANDLAGDLSTSFAKIKDQASAVDVKKTVEPLLDKLTTLKKTLGDKMPSLDSLQGTIDQLKTKFGDDGEIMKVLQPLLDKLQQLLR